MRVPDEILKCVCFVGYRMNDGTTRLAGTAFFCGRPLPSLPDRHFGYLVTAAHVISKIRDTGLDRVLLRLNRTGVGAIWVETPINDWISHPDPTIDLAVYRIAAPDWSDHRAFPLNSVVNDEIITAENIGIGTEVFVTGLFSHHYGQEQNTPIVRVGSIAAMRTARVATKVGQMDAYLIESRSIGGLSGSPVFAHPGVIRTTGDNAITFNTSFFLLGVVHGHYDETGTAAAVVNVGIAVVVPIARLLELLEIPPIRDPERAEEERLLNEATATPD